MSKSHDFNELLNSWTNQESNFSNNINKLNKYKAEGKPVFQVLALHEIQEYLNKKNINVEISQLSQPQPLHIVEIFINLLGSMRLIRKEKLTIQLNSTFTYEGYHENPLFLTKFFKLSENLFKNTLQIKDYTTGDLFTPQEKRVQKILSGLIALNKLHDKISISFNEFYNNSHNLEEKIKILEENKDSKQIEYNNIKIKVDNHKQDAEIKLENLNKENKIYLEYSNKLLELEKREKELVKDHSKLENSIKVLENEENYLNKSILQLKNEIIENPIDVKKLIQEKEAEYDLNSNKLDLIMQVEEKLNHFGTNLKDLNTAILEILNTKKLIENITNEVNYTKNENLKLKESVISLKKELLLKEEECLQLINKLESIKISRDQSEFNFSDKNTKLLNLIKQNEKENEMLNRTKDIKLKEKEMLQREIEILNKELEDLLLSEKEILSDFRSKIETAVKLSSNYSEKIIKSLKNIN